jgi:hypothetical protein
MNEIQFVKYIIMKLTKMTIVIFMNSHSREVKIILHEFTEHQMNNE